MSTIQNQFNGAATTAQGALELTLAQQASIKTEIKTFLDMAENNPEQMDQCLSLIADLRKRLQDLERIAADYQFQIDKGS